MRFIGIILSSPCQLDELLKYFNHVDMGVAEVDAGGRKLRFALCGLPYGIPHNELLKEAEEKRQKIKGSGVICITGALEMEKLVPHILNKGYRVIMLDLTGSFLYGRGLFPTIAVSDSKKLHGIMEFIL